MIQQQVGTIVDAEPKQKKSVGPSDRNCLRIAIVTAFILAPLLSSVAVFGYFAVLGRAILHEVRIMGVESGKAISSDFSRTLLAARNQELALKLQSSGEYNIHFLIVYGPSNDSRQQQIAEHLRLSACFLIGDGGEIRVLSIEEATFEDVLWSDAVVVGSAVRSSNVHPAVQRWINTWDITKDLSLKVGTAFVTGESSQSGNEHAMSSMIRSMMIFRMICVGGNTLTLKDEDLLVNHSPQNPHFSPHNHDNNSAKKALLLAASALEVAQNLNPSC